MASILLTGASTGIGWACVKVLTGRGFHVFAGVRRREDADRLRQAFGKAATPLLFDITDEALVRTAADEVTQRLAGEGLLGLVNNAGLAHPGPLLHLDIGAFRRQLEVNVTGQLIVTQAFAPLLGASKTASCPPGRVVMISSVSGRTGAPFIGAYAASKFALEGLSESLRRELMLFGVDVIVIAPGAVATPIWDKADDADPAPYADTPYAASLALVKAMMVRTGRQGLAPERIGQAVLTALTAARPRTRYVLTPAPLQTLLAEAMPKRMLDAVIARRIGLHRAKT